MARHRVAAAVVGAVHYVAHLGERDLLRAVRYA